MSARIFGSMRSRAVVKPRLAFLSADRALALVAGSRIVAAALPPASPAALAALPPTSTDTFAAVDAAWPATSRARSMKDRERPGSGVATSGSAGSVGCSVSSGMLDRDPLDDVGDVLGLVDGLLEETVDLLPLDDLERMAATREEIGDRLARELVALVLEPMDLDPVRLQPLEPALIRERLEQLLA